MEKGLAHYTRAIGHPARVAVLVAIARNGGEVHGDIIEVPPLSKSTVVQHLRELKRAGFIDGKIFGTKAYYSLNMQHLQEFDHLFRQFINTLNIARTEPPATALPGADS